MLRSCAFLTMTNLHGYVHDDALAVPPLADLGWNVTWVPWDQPGVDWNRFDMVVVRSTWDYHRRPIAFRQVLQQIGRANTLLVNPLELMQWNMQKHYLLDLVSKGVSVVPTIGPHRIDTFVLDGAWENWPVDQLILKPLSGANAEGIILVKRSTTIDTVRSLTGDAEYLIQPFQQTVQDEGEYACIVFNGSIAFAILKQPADGDFRVQEEHGGMITLTPITDLMRRFVDKVMSVLPIVPCYARVDFIALQPGSGYALMELELIEPSLYLRMHPQGPVLFAQTLDQWYADREDDSEVIASVDQP